jgi:hypothetical protein
MRRTLAFLLAASSAAMGCGGGSSPGPGDKPVPKVTTVRLTHRVPARVRALCAATQRDVRVHVVCPPLVPVGGIDGDPGITYADTYRKVKDFYALTFNNGEIPGKIHWVVGAGTPARVQQYVLSSRDWDVKGPVKRLESARYAGRMVTLYHFPLDPAGGLFGTHVVAMTRVGRLVQFASVHGYDHEDADIAMLIAAAEAGSSSR